MEFFGYKTKILQTAKHFRNEFKSSLVIIVGFCIPVSSLKVFGHSIHSERRRIYLGKSIQALQNNTIIISWVFSFRVIQPTVRWHTFKTCMFVFINSCHQYHKNFSRQSVIKGTNGRQKTYEIFHVCRIFYSGFMCQTTVIFGITKDGSLY